MVLSPDSLSAQDRENIRNAYSSLPIRIALTSIFCGFILATTILFVAYRKKRSIRAHSVSLIIAQTVAIFIGTPLATIQMSTYGAYPCFFAFIGLYYGLGTWVLCVIARAVRLYQIFLGHHAASRRYRDISLAATLLSNDESTNVWANSRNRPVGDVLTPEHNQPSVPPQHVKSIERRANLTAWIIVGIGSALITLYFMVILGATDFIQVGDDLFAPQDPSTVIGLPGKTKRGVSCHKDDPVWWPAFGLLAGFLLIFTPGALFVLRRMNDTYGIRQDLYITTMFSLPSFIVYFIVASVVWHFDGFGPNDVIYFVFGVSHFMSVVLPLYRMMKEEKGKAKIKMTLQSFEKVLKDPELFKELQRFAIRDFCSEQTIFIQEVHRLRAAAREIVGRYSEIPEPPSLAERKSLRKSPSRSALSSGGFEMQSTPSRSPIPTDTRPLPAQLVWQCAAILDVFIRPGSQMELNISASIRRACISTLESGYVTITVFDAAYLEVANSLFLNTYPKLVKSLGNPDSDNSSKAV
ncbi:hypothetical protein BJ742DRAFT_787162 [Cladochytrium replicatum]|nr:hypothetical protein BJ742DRAFT_787162 [Cladochytrium replicatum]